jgi:hypothetical protein
MEHRLAGNLVADLVGYSRLGVKGTWVFPRR